MAIKNLYGKRVTANQYAKWLIYDKIETAFYFGDYDHEHMTEKEKMEVCECLEKQQTRFRKLLGIDKINS